MGSLSQSASDHFPYEGFFLLHHAQIKPNALGCSLAAGMVSTTPSLPCRLLLRVTMSSHHLRGYTGRVTSRFHAQSTKRRRFSLSWGKLAYCLHVALLDMIANL
ncbi:hypothetical protein M758_5G008600 [Ceratodon purpureus]|nr:hypothetical protein M758_5G008600 [Ceratodon purpureus]